PGLNSAPLLLFTIFSYDFTPQGFAFLLLVGLLVGMAKTGVHGAGMMAVPLLAAVFCGHASAGLLLLMLVMADVMGVVYYHRHVSWIHLLRLFPWVTVWVLLGTVFGNYVNGETFRVVMAVIIVVSCGCMLWLERGHKQAVPDSP